MPGTESIPRLFGTDGIRAPAGRYPLDPPTVRRVGAALVRALPRTGDGVRLLVGRDPRESGAWIEEELARGAAGEGATMTSAGVVPTPAVAYLTRACGYDAGVVISASHNLYEDNGIKIFSGRGEKFTERVEREIEAVVADSSWSVRGDGGSPVPAPALVDQYLEHLRAVFPEASRMGTQHMVLDCANGATSVVAPRLFKSLGYDCVVIGDAPDGRNINQQRGSTAPEALAAEVVGRGVQLGVAFDGDGDRAIFVDHRGQIVNGDAVLLMCARQLQREARLTNDAIVATVMSNVGLEVALAETKIGLVRCAVGDKFVMEAMLSRGLALGGEQSGHVIFSEYLFTGDGLCTALNVLRTMALTGRSLADLASDLTSYPQVLLNVRVRERVELQTVPPIAAAIAGVEAQLAGHGRVLVRYSGTEPLLRVMVEGRDEQHVQRWAQEIVDVVKKQLA